MSLWTTYKSISPKTRIFLGFGLMANAALALQFSEQIEGFLGLSPTKQEAERLEKAMPRVSLIERDDVK